MRRVDGGNLGEVPGEINNEWPRTPMLIGASAWFSSDGAVIYIYFWNTLHGMQRGIQGANTGKVEHSRPSKGLLARVRAKCSVDSETIKHTKQDILKQPVIGAVQFASKGKPVKERSSTLFCEVELYQCEKAYQTPRHAAIS